MRRIVFCLFIGCVLGDFLTTTNEGVLLDEESAADIISYLLNKELTSETEDDAFDESSVTTVRNPWVTFAEDEIENDKDSVDTEYDMDLINNAQVVSSKNSVSPPPSTEEEERLFTHFPNDEEMAENPESDPDDEEVDPPKASSSRKRKSKRKLSSSRKVMESSKYKKNGKRYKPKYKISQLKKNWRKTCCSYGKKLGNSATTYLSGNLLDECGEKTRNLSSTQVTRQCKMIFLSCCENRALRRFYSEYKLNSTLES